VLTRPQLAVETTSSIGREPGEHKSRVRPERARGRNRWDARTCATAGAESRWRIGLRHNETVAREAKGDHVDIVRRGYDALSARYRADDARAGEYGPWIAELLAALSGESRVLDLGCGCGVPVARDLSARGHAVTGVDVSDVQIERARRLVPAANFIRADATRLRLPPESFDAVVALYSLIHMPLAAQPPLLHAIAGWLVRDGLLLLSAGWRAWTGAQTDWLGANVPMWWSHADAATYRRWLTEAGFEVIREQFVPEGDGGHSLFWARRAIPGR
jgi:SAM-dependent methyltransferase